MSPGATLMARAKRAAKAPAKPPEIPPDKVAEKREERVAIILLKGSREYADWLDRANRETHIPKASIIRLALAEWAERMGRPAPPEI